jgi:hypothetical protein
VDRREPSGPRGPGKPVRRIQEPPKLSEQEKKQRFENDRKMLSGAEERVAPGSNGMQYVRRLIGD